MFFLTLFLIFFWMSSFLLPEIINRENKLSQKKNQIDIQFLLTFQSLFLFDWFGFYFEAISKWDHAIAL